MKLVVFAPFGSVSEETGLIGLLANYVKGNCSEIAQLRCNGLFSLCERDSESNWRRGLQSCFACMHEQSTLANWAGIRSEDLSAFLLPEEVLESKRWVTALSCEELKGANFNGYALYDLCCDSFQYRFGSETPDLLNRNHEQLVRRMLISTIRSCLALDRFAGARKPDLALVAGGKDFITRSFVERLRAQKLSVAVFQWDITSRCVKIQHPDQSKQFECPLFFEDITAMRADNRTWPWELVRIIEDLLVFLDINSSQLALPMAR